MDKPKIIASAQNLIYGIISLATALSMLSIFKAATGVPQFIIYTAIVTIPAMIMAIIPFYIGRRSNIARYLYVATTVSMPLFIMEDSELGQNGFELYVNILLMLVDFYACSLLFRKESREWFSAKPQKAN